MRRQPMRGETGKRLAGALQRGPSEKLTRVSPGVYRNAQGQLTGPGGRPQQSMGQRIARGMQGPQNVGQGIASGLQQGGNLMGQNIAQGMEGPIAPSIAQNLQQGGQAQQPQMGSAIRFANEAAPNPNDTVGLAVQPLPGINLPMDKMYRFPMPEPSANMGGQYRLSPGVYGSREQAMQQYLQQINQPYIPGPASPQAPMQSQEFVPYPYWMRKG